MNISNDGLSLLKTWEQAPLGGFAARAYRCSAGKKTIGWGHVITPIDNIKEPIDIIQAENILKNDIRAAEEAVNQYVKAKLPQKRFDALVCLIFNIGVTNFKNSTLLKLLNKYFYDKVPDQFMRWVYVNKVFVKGLENRRKAEVALWGRSQL